MDPWTTNEGPTNPEPWAMKQPIPVYGGTAPVGAQQCLRCHRLCLPRSIYSGIGMEAIEVATSAYCIACEGAEEYRAVASAVFWQERRRQGHSDRLEGTKARV